MKDGFAKVTKAFKKDLKKASQKKKKHKHKSEDTDSSWSVGSGTTGDSNVISKSKRLKLDIPSSPVKTTLLDNFSSLEQMLTNNLEQVNHSILSEKIGVTAIVPQ